MNKLSKILLFSLLLTLLFALTATADSGFTVRLDPEQRLVNTSIKSSQSITYGFNVTGGNISSNYVCQLHTTEAGSSGPGAFTNVETVNSISNNTNYNFTLRTSVAETNVAINNYTWAVNCSSSEGRSTWSNISAGGTNYTFGVDVTAPVVTVNGPSDGGWFSTNNSHFINLTVVDSNAQRCALDTNMNVSTASGTLSNNGTVGDFRRAFSTFDYTNNTAFNFSRLNNTGAINWSEKFNGTTYQWNYLCNDTAGNVATLSANRSFYIDVTLPSAFAFDLAKFYIDHRLIHNNSRATDYRPQIGWETSTENNFSRYEVFFYNGSFVRSGEGGFNALNVSTRTTNVTNLTDNLAADTSYFINVTAFDLAGNKREMTLTGYGYTTWSGNRQLKSGWSIFGNIGHNFTLSEVLNFSGATTASIWNSTHQFQSHVSGGSYGGVVVTPGTPVLIYLSNDTTFNDMIYNATSVANVVGPSSVFSSLAVNFTNQSASDWNLVVNSNSTYSPRLNQLDNATNICRTYADCDRVNISSFVWFNTSATLGAKHVPYVGNWTFNNATTVNYGDAVWAFLKRGSSDVLLDWGNISGY